MIINGGSRTNGAFFAKHLMRGDTNERVEVCEIRGVCADNIRDALREMEAVASGTPIKNYFYHANINPRETEHLTPEQWLEAVDTLERNLGLTGQPRFVVEHEKDGRAHRHVVWSRVDLESMHSISDSLNYAAHERTSRELEMAFGLERGESVLTGERSGPRPERAPESWAMFRAQETGIDPRDVKREVTTLWEATDSGKAFVAALESAGYTVALGDRRDFVIFDQAAEEHSLARRISGVNVAELGERMADVDRASLPTFEQGKEIALARQTEREAQRQGEAEQQSDNGTTAAAPERGLNATQTNIRLAFSLTESGAGFAKALEDQDLILARVTDADLACRDRSELGAMLEAKSRGVWMHAEGGVSQFTPAQLESARTSYAAWDPELRAKYDFDNYVDYTQRKHAERLEELTRAADLNPEAFLKTESSAPAIPSYIRADELVVVNARGHIYSLNERTLGISKDEIASYLGEVDRTSLMSVGDAQAAMAEAHNKRWQSDRSAAHLERKADTHETERAAESAVHGMEKSATKSFTVLCNTGEKLIDLVEGAADFFFATPRRVSPEEAMRSQAAMIEHAEALAFDEHRDRAYDRMMEERAAGKHLTRDDVRYLSETDRENYRRHGDSGLDQMFRDHEIEQERRRHREL